MSRATDSGTARGCHWISERGDDGRPTRSLPALSRDKTCVNPMERSPSSNIAATAFDSHTDKRKNPRGLLGPSGIAFSKCLGASRRRMSRLADPACPYQKTRGRNLSSGLGYLHAGVTPRHATSSTKKLLARRSSETLSCQHHIEPPPIRTVPSAPDSHRCQPQGSSAIRLAGSVPVNSDQSSVNSMTWFRIWSLITVYCSLFTDTIPPVGN